MIKTATLSPCGQFRYHLTRRWGNGGMLQFIMLNPSTADADLDDATIRKCIGFARRNGYEAIGVVNLYAFRATDPKVLKAAGYPVGEDNDKYLRLAINLAREFNWPIVCAWGANARGLPRALEVLRMLRDNDVPLLALAKLGDGITPAHPLMLSYARGLIRL